jgi:hypothetical protein
MQKGKKAGYFSDNFKDLVQQMLALEDKRITMEDIKKHPWYTSDDVPTIQEI